MSFFSEFSLSSCSLVCHCISVATFNHEHGCHSSKCSHKCLLVYSSLACNSCFICSPNHIFCISSELIAVLWFVGFFEILTLWGARVCWCHSYITSMYIILLLTVGNFEVWPWGVFRYGVLGCHLMAYSSCRVSCDTEVESWNVSACTCTHTCTHTHSLDHLLARSLIDTHGEHGGLKSLRFSF